VVKAEEEEGRDDPPGLERWKSLMEKKKVEMTPRMERWKSLIEKTEEEGGDDP
jgi:hypothetical protein